MGHAIAGVEGVYDVHEYRHEKADALAKLAALIDGIVDQRPAAVAPLRLTRREMTKGLPATLEDAEMAAVEDEAVARARSYVHRLKSGEISAQPLELRDSEGAAPWSWFGRENSRAWVKARLKARLKASAVNPQLASFVCGLARDGLSVADEALREIIIEHKERDEKLLTSLRAYDIEITQAGRRRQGGWDTTEVVLRNLAIALRHRRRLPCVRPASDPFAGLAAPRPERLLYRGARSRGGTRSHHGVGRREDVDAIQLPSPAGRRHYAAD